MQYLRRFLWYIAKRLLGVTLLFGALIIAFYMAMNTSNILILLKDGMALRAQVIMMEEEPASLTKFFQEDFVRLDTALNVGLSSESPYADYDITEAEANDPSSVYPPAWSTSRYRATLVRENGRWKIASLKLMETLP